MLTFIFLFSVAVIGAAAYFISVAAKRGKNGRRTRSPENVTDAPKVGRASGGDD